MSLKIINFQCEECLPGLWPFIRAVRAAFPKLFRERDIKGRQSSGRYSSASLLQVAGQVTISYVKDARWFISLSKSCVLEIRRAYTLSQGYVKLITTPQSGRERHGPRTAHTSFHSGVTVAREHRGSMGPAPRLFLCSVLNGDTETTFTGAGGIGQKGSTEQPSEQQVISAGTSGAPITE